MNTVPGEQHFQLADPKNFQTVLKPVNQLESPVLVIPIPKVKIFIIIYSGNYIQFYIK